MSLSKTYLEQHADSARNGRGTDKADYETFGRQVAELIMREASKSDAVKVGEAEKVELSNLTATLRQNTALICVDVQVCAPIVGCITAHVGA
ncbi:hypothetical protein [Phenylobacterium sp.]|uniref:hypothetical protein n=1 Tax=Phenylobacterium sp. TaxID=1871053 RepID=UPI00356B0069